MQTQSALPGGLREQGSTYLSDVHGDFGGHRAHKIAQLAANRHLGQDETSSSEIERAGLTARMRALGSQVMFVVETMKETIFPDLYN